jgi:hypothetical protein
MATITEELSSILEAQKQFADIISVRALMKPPMSDIPDMLAKIQAIVDSGNFDLAPPEMKAALIKQLNMYKALAEALQDADIQELHTKV